MVYSYEQDHAWSSRFLLSPLLSLMSQKWKVSVFWFFYSVGRGFQNGDCRASLVLQSGLAWISPVCGITKNQAKLCLWKLIFWWRTAEKHSKEAEGTRSRQKRITGIKIWTKETFDYLNSLARRSASHPKPPITPSHQLHFEYNSIIHIY